MHHVGKSQKTVMKWQFFAPQPVPIAIGRTRYLYFFGKYYWKLYKTQKPTKW